jgi:hypothetical protein
MPDVQFDVVAGAFSEKAAHGLPANITVHSVGVGRSIDKYFLPFMGAHVAYRLHRQHRYLFAWSLMASYAAIAGILLKHVSRLPLLITFADQNFDEYGMARRVVMSHLVNEADQVYGMGRQEEHAAKMRAGRPLRQSIGEGDAFANQLRYAYADILLRDVSL